MDTKKYPQFIWLYQTEQERGNIKKVLQPDSTTENDYYFSIATRQQERWEDLLSHNKMDNYMEAQATLIDLMLLSEGDAYVGKPKRVLHCNC